MQRRPIPLLAIAAVLCSQAAFPKAEVIVRGHRVTIRNADLARTFDTTEGLRTVRVMNRITDSKFDMDSPDFRLKLLDGPELTGTDFEVKKVVRKVDGPGLHAQVTLRLENSDHRLAVDVTYHIDDVGFVLHKRLEVRSLGGDPQTLDWVDVDELSGQFDVAVGGFGQPAFINEEMFVGLEYPAGYTQVTKADDGTATIRLRHYPGKVLTDRPLACKPAVLGASGRDWVASRFARYLDGICQPPRSFLHYNSWYDIRRREMSTERFAATFRIIKEKMLDPYAIKLDAFAPDDGWDDRVGLWRVDPKLFPDGFRPLAEFLEAGGTRLGLWMPLTGCRVNKEWGIEHGFEPSVGGGWWCMAAPVYNRAIREACKERIREGNLAYLKHDFNFFACSGEGHGHLPDRLHGQEANVDAYIDLLRYEKELQPDIWLNITGGTWMSPWWVTHADSVWIGTADTGHDRTVPALRPRDSAITYRDIAMYDRYHTRRLQFPPSRLMTHGITYARYNFLGGKDESLLSFADNCIMYYGRGVLMKELYISPDLLTDEMWRVLGESTRWSVERWEDLMDSHMVGGDPRQGDAYGYVHRGKGRVIQIWRNPSLRPQEVPLWEYGAAPGFMLFPRGAGEAVRMTRFPGTRGAPNLYRVTYPFKRIGSAESMRSSSEELSVGEVRVAEAVKGYVFARPLPKGPRYELQSAEPTKTTYILYAPAQTTKDVRILGPEGRLSVSFLGQTAEFPPETPKNERKVSVPFPGARPQISGARFRREESADAIRVVFQARLGDVPPLHAEVVLLVRGAARPSAISVGGQRANTARTDGAGWTIYRADCTALRGTQEVVVTFSRDAREPFRLGPVKVTGYLMWSEQLSPVQMTIDHPPVSDEPPDPLPPSVEPDVQRHTIVVFREKQVDLAPRVARQLTPGDLKTITAAKLCLDIFGVNTEAEYADKPLMLNGEQVATVPGNGRPLDAWKTVIVDIPPEKLSLIRPVNEVVLHNKGGDCYKFRNVALAVRLPDGTWVQSDVAAGVYCSVPAWLYHEGATFTDGRSPPVELALPVRE